MIFRISAIYGWNVRKSLLIIARLPFFDIILRKPCGQNVGFLNPVSAFAIHRRVSRVYLAFTYIFCVCSFTDLHRSESILQSTLQLTFWWIHFYMYVTVYNNNIILLYSLVPNGGHVANSKTTSTYNNCSLVHIL